MRNISDCQIVEIKIDGVWTPIHWEQLDAGDIIRFRNPDGSDPSSCTAPEQIVLYPVQVQTKNCSVTPDLTRKHTTSLVSRLFSNEPEGPNDRAIDIWYNNNWIPAFFSNLRKGDFFIDLNANLDPGRCFHVTSSVMRSTFKGLLSFVVQGMEIVQAPEKTIELQSDTNPLLEAK